MNNKFNSSVVALSLVAGLNVYAADECSGLFANNSAASALTSQFTRFQATHPYADGSLAVTSEAREQEIARRIKLMEQEIFGEGSFNHPDIPSIELVAEDGVVVKVLEPTNTNHIPKIVVSGVPGGVLRATLLLPVSGHTDSSSTPRAQRNATRWATTDTYRITRTDSINNSEAPLFQDAKSLAPVTSHEVVIPLVKGTTTIYYYRSGSGGPGGYPPGRTLYIEWNGN